MRDRADAIIWLHRLLSARNVEDAKIAEQEIGASVSEFVRGFDASSNSIQRSTVGPRMLPPGRSFPISSFPDEQLLQLNSLLPWAAMTVDENGRHLGSAWRSNKRENVQFLVEGRHVAFNKAYPLAGKHVLEVGCFEGIHTISCLHHGATVTAVDSRIENLLKTLTRLWCYGYQADVKRWDLEEDAPADIPRSWDMLHHIGVLYHLSDPVGHLRDALKRTREALLLDTHIAQNEGSAVESYDVDGRTFRFERHGERSVSPFAGVRDHAKWLVLDELRELIAAEGFKDVRVKSDRAERNGRRVTLWAFR